eukprot:gene26371-64330_t
MRLGAARFVPTPKSQTARAAVVGFLQRKLTDLAVFNYPYPVNFTGLSLPAHP